MLESLYLENIALVEKLNIDFSAGLTVLTGETGGGKSIIIDSLLMLCGGRCGRELIRTGCDAALVEGVFDLTDLTIPPDSGLPEPEDGKWFLSRRIGADGRSACRMNGRAVPLAVLRQAAGMLLNIHGQQDTQTLSDPTAQRTMLDAYAGDGALRKAYEADYDAYTSVSNALALLQKQEGDKTEQLDILQFRIRELEQLKPRAGEEPELEAESLRLRNAERIRECTFAAHEALDGGSSAVSRIDRAIAALKRLSGIVPSVETLLPRLDSCRAELTDIAETVRDEDVEETDTTARLDRIEEKLALYARLEKKYLCDGDGLPAVLADLKKKREMLDQSGERAGELRKKLRELEQNLQHTAAALTEARKKAADALCDAVRNTLNELDMPSVTFVTAFQAKKHERDGADEISFLLSPNKGEEPRPMAKIASGGELSRIMLAVKSALAEADGVRSVVFDEIDTGISGKTSEKIGRLLLRLGRTGQVFCVTHSAQIASLADHHLLVAKSSSDERTVTTVRALTGEERVREIARIMGGIQITETVLAAAREAISRGQTAGLSLTN